MKSVRLFLTLILSVFAAQLASADEGYFARQGFNTNSIVETGSQRNDQKMTEEKRAQRTSDVDSRFKSEKKKKRDISSDSFLDDNFFFRSSPAN